MITGILETICRWEIQTRPSIGELEGAQVEQVKNWINDFNVEANAEYMSKLALPESAERDLLVLAFAGEALVGGLVGGTRMAWLKIHMLGISPTHRLCGIGSQLIAEAEREALGRGCRYAYVDTMCFQAPQFASLGLQDRSDRLYSLPAYRNRARNRPDSSSCSRLATASTPSAHRLRRLRNRARLFWSLE